ncbi:MAG: transcription termination/antitermination protein NusA [Bacilli bacterium]|nr:transcription termination/antitermination protein NusA [Bacilli bacterium]
MNKEEFIKAVDIVAKEKGIEKDLIFDAMELALTSAYKKNFDSKTNVRVDINKDTGEIKVFSVLHVVDEINEEDEEKDSKILLPDAVKMVPGITIGETIETEVTPKDFGRVATSTAKQVVTQKIREAERNSIMSEFEGKQDELLVGQVSREDALNYYIDLGRAHGILAKKELIPGEKIEMGSSIKVYATKIEDTGKGPLILLSRAHYGFVKRLLELEVPELAEGIVKLYSVARDPGSRSKVAVYSDNPKVDAIGACIGEKSSRISRIMKELNGEKLDIVLYDKDPVTFIKNALSPAKEVNVIIMDPKENVALAVADGDQLSLAIGKKGQNVRLAARLTKYRIDVKTSAELRESGINIGFE